MQNFTISWSRAHTAHVRVHIRHYCTGHHQSRLQTGAKLETYHPECVIKFTSDE